MLPDLHMFPGMLGDDHGFRALTDSLSDRYVTHLLRHPDTDGAHGLEQAARAAVLRICRLQPAGPVSLLGYSYGANLAFEAAHLLKRESRVVAFLVLLDPALPTTEFGVFDGTPARTVERRHNRPSLLVRLLRRRAIWPLLGALPNSRATRKLLKALRMRARRWARRGWQPRRLDVSGLLVVSTQLQGATAEALVQLCPNMDLLVVEARHLDLLSNPSRGLIARAVSELRDRPPRPASA